jgi:class 3 adenylate cyclase
VAAAESHERRKMVTVLFCDVSGSTALGERLDPESFRGVMARFFGVARRVIELHGGTVEKFIGDAVMAVFGVPVLHEDDALRAVLAAARLREEIGVLNGGLEAEFGASVSIRTGVNTGQVIVGMAEALATGDAVNVAARLEQAAVPGEIVIGAQTFALVQGAVVAERLEPLQLKGKSLPVAAYRLLQVPDGDAAALPRRAGGTLVGRRGQLRLLGDALANVAGERSCTLFTVLGAAGVGKSRLVAEFLVSAGARAVTGQCLSYGLGITYWPVVSVVRQLLDPERDFAAAAELMAGDGRVASAIGVLLGGEAAVTSPAEIAWAVRRLLECCAETAPLTVVFEDLHWAEPVLLDLIEHVADFSRGAPILILCLARPELLDRRPGWGGGKLNAASLLLEPLAPAEAGELVDQLTGGGLEPRLRDRVLAAAAGNPLFVEEMLALLGEQSTGEPGSSDVIVPLTIRALLAARLDQLLTAERTVLECGSVEGQSFHSGAVQVMAPGEEDVAGRLMTLTRKDLVRPDRSTLPGGEAFRFRHLLIRDAAYDGLSKSDRAGLHERFARWLEERGQGVVELDEIVGYHLEQAFGYRRELGPADERARRLAADAARHLDAAGRRALDRGDTGTAVSLLERAESLLPPREIILALQQSLIHGLGMAGRLTDAIARAARIAGECSAAGDRAGELSARLAGTIWRVRADPAGNIEELRTLVGEARPLIEQGGDAAARASLEYAAGFIDFFGCRFGAALAAYTAAMDHARHAGDLWFESRMRPSVAACFSLGPAPVSAALEWLDAARARSGYQPQLDMARTAMLAELGRFDEARSLLAETIAQMNQRGLARSVAASTHQAWEIEVLAGDDAAAESAARHGCEQLEQLGEQSWLSTLACQLADALYALGRYQESGQWASRGLDLGSSDDVATQVFGLGVQSRLLARQGETSAAVALSEKADSLARTSDSPNWQGNAALSLAEVLYLTGDRAGSAKAAERAIACYQDKGATAYVARAQRLTAAWAV